VTGLLQHEAKLSVLNFGLKKTATYEDPIANKQELLFVTGLRWRLLCVQLDVADSLCLMQGCVMRASPLQLA